ncbi:MAG: ABC-F family ATP-binding cassette domain-containing protein [Chitinophagales bacterium]|nr:ABC-F family ATP-binding cassette domain-containing protein [Chitinophagales bacterium]
MINISNLSIQYGGRFLFDDLSFAITKQDRIGLVGKNGAGKTTLLKLITGNIRPESGSITFEGGTTIGYLPQEVKTNSTKTVYEETATAFAEIQKLEQEIAQLSEAISHTEDYESPQYYRQLQSLSDLQDRLHHLGAGNRRETTEKILKGLGFANGDFDRPLREFSGGWQMRVELAKILLQQPSYILLDEPTNHLDIESIMWLEDFLSNYNGGVVLISHDKMFLDRITNRIVELVSGKMYDYRGVNYTDFTQLRQQRRETQINAAKRQEKEIEHAEMLIEKFRAKKNKAAFAQTLIAKLEKTERIEIDDVETAALKFRFPDAPRSGKVVVNIEGLNKNYGNTKVLQSVQFSIERGEKVAFIGKNGEGKTTLTKIIAQQEPPTNGLIQLGHNVLIGYYEQHQAENLAGNQSVFQVIDDAATGDMRTRVRSLLAAFLFNSEDIDKKVQVLSGGEKSRLALAKMLLMPINLLILDEPTNHLDMQAKTILKQAIQNYNGTVIIVSHDRDFLTGLTDKVYEFNNKQIKPYLGDIAQFLEERQLQRLDELSLGMRRSNASETAVQMDEKQKRENVRLLEKQIKTQQNKISKTERNIADLEKQVAEYEQTMAADDFYTTHPNPNQYLATYNLLKTQLDNEMTTWEEQTIQLETMQEEKTALEQ